VAADSSVGWVREVEGVECEELSEDVACKVFAEE
jgi:hypothetical protein